MINYLIVAFISFLIGALLSWVFNLLKTGSIRAKTGFLKEQISQLQAENESLKKQEKQFIEQNSQLKTQMQAKQRELDNSQKNLEEMASKLKLEFKTTANEIFKETAKNFRESTEHFKKDSRDSIENMLKPVKEDFDQFQKMISSFDNTGKDFQKHFDELKKMNVEMRDSSHKLTESLQGSTKAQGDWGEFVLKRILEQAGLKEGEEYFTQGKDLNLKDDEGSSSKPDVVVKLPDDKHIIIDSKTSIAHYIQYKDATDESKKEEYKSKIIRSLLTHIENLSTKNYSSLGNLKSPEFVLMFIPAEPIFSIAIQDKKMLFEKAWEKKIVIVSPITLYASLKTIASIWNVEKQNRNAEQIAKASGALYDKFCGFLNDMEKINTGIKSIGSSYDSAFNKLSSGKGNLIQKVENIKKLGAKTSKQIPASFQD